MPLTVSDRAWSVSRRWPRSAGSRGPTSGRPTASRPRRTPTRARRRGYAMPGPVIGAVEERRTGGRLHRRRPRRTGSRPCSRRSPRRTRAPTSAAGPDATASRQLNAEVLSAAIDAGSLPPNASTGSMRRIGNRSVVQRGEHRRAPRSTTAAFTIIVPVCGRPSKPQYDMCSMRSCAGPTGQPGVVRRRNVGRGHRSATGSANADGGARDRDGVVAIVAWRRVGRGRRRRRRGRRPATVVRRRRRTVTSAPSRWSRRVRRGPTTRTRRPRARRRASCNAPQPGPRRTAS